MTENNTDTSSPRLAVGTVFYLGPWSAMNQAKLDADDPFCAVLRLDDRWRGRGTLAHPLSAAVGSGERVAVVPDEAEPAGDLSVPEMFGALGRGIDAFEECLSSHGVEHRRLNFGSPHEHDGVRFPVGDEHWVAEFYDNGNFKLLAWV